MNHEGLVSQVDDSGHPVAGLKGRHRPRDELAPVEVLDSAVVVAVLDILQQKMAVLIETIQNKWNAALPLPHKYFVELRTRIEPVT